MLWSPAGGGGGQCQEGLGATGQRVWLRALRRKALPHPLFCSGPSGELGGPVWGFQTLPLVQLDRLSSVLSPCEFHGAEATASAASERSEASRSAVFRSLPHFTLPSPGGRGRGRLGIESGAGGPPPHPYVQPRLTAQWAWPALGAPPAFCGRPHGPWTLYLGAGRVHPWCSGQSQPGGRRRGSCLEPTSKGEAPVSP